MTPTEYFEKCHRTHDEQGLLHSFNDEPCLVTPKGHKIWYNHGIIHRENGPATIYGDEYQWFIDAKDKTKETIAALAEEGIDITNLTEEQREYVLSYPAK